MKGLYNYFIPCHRKYIGKMGKSGVIQLNCTDRWEGSVEYLTIIPRVRMGYESIAHEDEGRMGY